MMMQKRLCFCAVTALLSATTILGAEALQCEILQVGDEAPASNPSYKISLGGLDPDFKAEFPKGLSFKLNTLCVGGNAEVLRSPSCEDDDGGKAPEIFNGAKVKVVKIVKDRNDSKKDVVYIENDTVIEKRRRDHLEVVDPPTGRIIGYDARADRYIAQIWETNKSLEQLKQQSLCVGGKARVIRSPSCEDEDAPEIPNDAVVKVVKIVKHRKDSRRDVVYIENDTVIEKRRREHLEHVAPISEPKKSFGPDYTRFDLKPSEIKPLYTKRGDRVQCSYQGKRIKGKVVEMVKGTGKEKWQGFLKIKVYHNSVEGFAGPTKKVPLMNVQPWDGEKKVKIAA